MSDRACTPAPTAFRLSAEEEAGERAALLYRLHQFAHATGASAGDDVVRWFDSRLRAEIERETARRRA